jgi:hypothetical protein
MTSLRLERLEKKKLKCSKRLYIHKKEEAITHRSVNVNSPQRLLVSIMVDPLLWKMRKGWGFGIKGAKTPPGIGSDFLASPPSIGINELKHTRQQIA